MIKITDKEIQDNIIRDLQNNSNMIGIYAFYDLKAKRHDTPFFCQSDMFAQRHYKMVTDTEGTMLNKFKEDFNVHRLGFFNLESGDLSIEFETIIKGKNFNKKETK